MMARASSSAATLDAELFILRAHPGHLGHLYWWRVTFVDPDHTVDFGPADRLGPTA